MKAARVHRFGERLQVDEVPEPQPGPEEVLAEIAYASVNPVDIWTTKGTVGGGKQPLPFVPGSEAAAMVDGRPVLLTGGGFGGLKDGFYRQLAAVPRSLPIPLPEGVDPAQAAGLGVVGVTAWNLVHQVANVKQGEAVLVLGATGGVGTLLVQVLRAQGADVWAQTGSADKSGGLQRLGVEHVVVADAAALADQVGDQKFDVVMDPLGGGFTDVAIHLLKPFGRIALFGVSAGDRAELDLRGLYRNGGSILGYAGLQLSDAQKRPALEAVLAEMRGGRLRVPIAEVLPLDRAAEAHQRLLDRRVEGKLLLDPRL